MNTLELLLKIHDAIGNTYPEWDGVPVKIAVLIPEIRVKIMELQRENKEPVIDLQMKGN